MNNWSLMLVVSGMVNGTFLGLILMHHGGWIPYVLLSIGIFCIPVYINDLIPLRTSVRVAPQYVNITPEEQFGLDQIEEILRDHNAKILDRQVVVGIDELDIPTATVYNK